MPVLDKTSIAAFVRPAWENILASGAAPAQLASQLTVHPPSIAGSPSAPANRRVGKNPTPANTQAVANATPTSVRYATTV